MGTMATVRVNTTQHMVIYRDCIILECLEGWQWIHDDYHTNGASGTRDTVFEAIEAVDKWHKQMWSEAAQ